MQFFADGYHPGDPTIAPEHPQRWQPGLPAEIDVLIVGTGPAGLVLAAQLARFPGIRTRIVERRTGPLLRGQADGVSCRSVEMLQAFGIAQKLLSEAYWVNETIMWQPDPDDRRRIVRTSRVQDVADGLSEMPHVIMNQARVHDYLLESARAQPARLEPDYGWEFVSLQSPDDDGPVLVTLAHRDDTGEATGRTRTIRARYVIGADGARSRVRTAIGRALSGDAANHAWGVMDVLADSDFPDLRFKTMIQSDGHGSILLIPREGGRLVRVYVDLGTVTDESRERVRAMTAAEITDIANGVLHPYSLDVKQTVWSSVYEVAQRIADGFDDAAGRDRAPRVFIAGDACHTHSAKAGQGMNVSMQDAFNLGWKLAAVLEGRADASLLETYDAERRPIAQELIDFDREWSAMLAQPAQDPDHPERGGVTAAELATYWARQGRYTAGVAARYAPGRLTGKGTHQHLATGFEIGTRFHSAEVVRVGDGRLLQLGHTHEADGRWRLYAFADAGEQALRALLGWLRTDPSSPVVRTRRDGDDIDALIDVRAILQSPLHDVDFAGLPEILRPRTGRLGLVDYEKAFTAAPTGSAATAGIDIYGERGVSREAGALVVVRPDQYVAHVLPLDARGELTGFFEGILLSAS
ncbi:FAD-dependent monooxygenase [Microbacterium stercoris]|uniref:FAD-dependent monooxygenase n=1 Tax=Microbacterium stercoris TaxID=2820289 RepID=A0A939QNR6_9MICO|nr:FAD-dependent monooxygenase [Microbacterium stercoris]MBO3661901.1 FAD-dependent monooxygenase [Microbacterium stercoris]